MLKQLYTNTRHKVLFLKKYRRLENFVFFIGYSRSGASLIGSIIDSHKNALISHESNIFKTYSGYKNKFQIYNYLERNSRNSASSMRKTGSAFKKHYTYEIKNLWQGKYEVLQSIGEKNSEVVAQKFIGDSKDIITNFMDLIDLNFKFIHSIRNPFDNISTMYLFEKKKNFNNRPSLRDNIEHYFNLVTGVQNCIDLNYDIINIYHEKLFLNYNKQIKLLFQSLNIPIDNDFINLSKNLLNSTPHETRNYVSWEENDIDLVYSKIEEFDFIKKYKFH